MQKSPFRMGFCIICSHDISKCIVLFDAYFIGMQ